MHIGRVSLVFQLSVVESWSAQTVRDVGDHEDSRLPQMKWKSMFSLSS